MSVCTEHCNFKTNQNNFSQSLSFGEKTFKELADKPTKWKILKQISTWISRSKQRKALKSLDQRMLTDIGYTAEQARQEFIKPFWK